MSLAFTSFSALRHARRSENAALESLQCVLSDQGLSDDQKDEALNGQHPLRESKRMPLEWHRFKDRSNFNLQTHEQDAEEIVAGT